LSETPDNAVAPVTCTWGTLRALLPGRPIAPPGWIAEIKDNHGILIVAQALGLKIVRAYTMTPCPVCKVRIGEPETRKRGLRGPIVLCDDGRTWKCKACASTGDSVGLAALLVMGRCPQSEDELESVHKRCAQRHLCRPPENRA
jgi:hypothetical protein